MVINAYSQEPSPPITKGQVQPGELNSKSGANSNIKSKGDYNRSPNTMSRINNRDTKSGNAKTQNTYKENSNSQAETVKDDPITRYTFWLMIFTGALVICNVGLWLYTRKAANAAKKGAESLPLIENAYIFVEVEEDINKKAAKIPFDEIKIVVITVRNYGRTPAIIKEARLWMDYDVTETPKENRIHVPDVEEIKIIPGIVLSSGEPVSVNAQVEITAAEWDKIKTGKVQWHCWGIIKYENIFKAICESGFDWRWHPLLGRFISSNNEKLNYHT